ncbi:MAG: S8 family serine peptidase, partial [Melioribacteraceae bacterium]|nr:S8 family serine peptidase [Melioribacteraceae bacterium]
DTYRDDQWHLDQTSDNDIDAEAAWDIETGDSEIIVAILDTGVRYFHKDLGGSNGSYANPSGSQGNMWINESDNNTNGVDDDNNNFTDDWIGWDFVTGITSSFLLQHVPGEDYDVGDNDPRDFNGHGTHCSGIVSAINNNGYGVSSPAGGWNDGSQSPSGNGVKIMALRIGYSINYFLLGIVGLVEMDFAAQAFQYAADNGARIASCSWGSSNSGGIGDAIDYFIASGGIVLKSAGNSDDEESDYMLDRSDVIGVASTDENDVKSDFSTYGTFVDISAPGSAILSTYHVYDEPETDYFAALSGTSMATPLTAAVAALIWSKNKNWTAAQVKNKLFDTADDIYSIAGNSSYTGKLGVGRVNAYNALSKGSVDLKVFLEGPFFSGSMDNTLNTGGHVPLESPYLEDVQTLSEIPNNQVVDWVMIELRDKNNSDVIVEQKSALLLNNGKVVDLDGVSLPQFSKNDDNYFVVIKHRNHIPVMSSTTINLSN